MLVLGAGLYVVSRSKRRSEENPDDEELEAERFYRQFHWGRGHRKKKRVGVSPLPSWLVRLGLVESITYSAKKGVGKAIADYVHKFGEGGTRKPILAADAKTKRLHIIGGGYDVKPAGIVG